MTQPSYPYLMAPSGGYVFVVTYGRSGSTLTQNLLNAIDGYCIRGENGNITQFLSKASQAVAAEPMFAWRREDIGKPKEERRPYTRGLVGQRHDPWYGAENVDPDDWRLSMMDLFVHKILCLPPDCRVGGFKEIRQWMDAEFFGTHLDILRASFPRARILFQKRQVDDLARSQWWAKMEPGRVNALIARADRMFDDYAARHPADCFVIRYEDYLGSIDQGRRIMDFLGESLSDARIRSVLETRLRH